MSENARSGFIKFIHPNGYGFVECDDDTIGDSFIPPNLIKMHGLSANDELRYVVSQNKGKEAVDQILSINGTAIIVKEKIPKNRPGKFTGNVSQISAKSGQATISLDDYCDKICCNQKLLKKHEISIGDNIEFTIRDANYSKFFDFEVSRIITLNGEMIREKVPSSIAGKVRSLLSRPTKKLTKLFLSFTSGGDDKKLIERYAGAQESLKPFIEYADNSIEAAKNQRNTLRFRWEEVKKPRNIVVRPNFTTIVANVEAFQYTTSTKNLQVGERLITDNDELNRISKIGQVDEDGFTPFSTEKPLDDFENWQRINDGKKLDYSTSSSTPVITSVENGSKSITILQQVHNNGEINLTLDGIILQNEKLLFDGASLQYKIQHQDFFTQLKDKNGDVICESGQPNAAIEVKSLPQSPTLHDQSLFPYNWENKGSSNKKHTIRLILHEDVENRLDPSNDDDPYDWIFSPNREVYELEIEGKKFIADKVKISNKKINTKTVQVEELPPEGSILTSAPRTRLIRAQRDMLNELMNHSLPHNEALLKLLAPGDEKERTKLWDKNSPNGLNNEPNWVVLTGNAKGTETQKEMVRIALESSDITVLQGPPGSGKSTTILEIVYQSILRGENILLCGSTQASIDNVLGRIIDEPILSSVISPVRIGDPTNIYDEKIKQLTLAKQRTNWQKKFGLDANEAKEFILNSSNLTCGTMESILSHPWIKEARVDGIESRGTASRVTKSPQPHWDVLIIDESSKTTFNEFIVPAMFCKKFVLVGDIRQLPPFTQETEFIANLESINGFNKNKQRSMMLYSDLSKIKNLVASDESLMMVEHNETVSGLIGEMLRRNRYSDSRLGNNITFISCDKTFDNSNLTDHGLQIYTPEKVKQSPHTALKVLNNGIIIADQTSAGILQRMLPPMPVIFGPRIDTNSLENLNRKATDFRKHSKFKDYNLSFKNGKKIEEIDEWSSEVSWRLARLSELKISDTHRTKQRYKKALSKLIPIEGAVTEAIDQIQLIALPSVMECLQEGFRPLDDSPKKLQSTLTHGFPKASFDEVRFKMLDYQHRMEPEISVFPRDKFYEGKALKDADTISLRNRSIPFTYRNKEPAAIWENVNGQEENGFNPGEITAIENELQKIFEWAKDNPRTDGKSWTVAVLTPYGRQCFNLLQMVKQLTGQNNDFRFDLNGAKNPTPIELVVSSTDKYQGQEADIVLISLVKTGSYGFLDSWNRMNVAITRAKRKRIIFGKYANFSRAEDSMLSDLAKSHTGKALVRKEREL
ncbi:AAA domain-containing protein [Candidatus Poseidonia alphae]|nr:AAA domain-containing protein [Candidatus Poseidonia alphae]